MKFILLTIFFSLPFSLHAATNKRPLSLTLSGGVSLAAYETGFIYYLSQHLHDSERSELKIVTGTSAGSINSIIAVLNACQVNTASPQESINWKVWVPLGIEDIVDTKKVTPISLFSREGLDKYSSVARKAFLAGLKQDCDVVVGMAVTRKTPLKVEIKPGLTTDRHNEFFLFKIKGRGPGKPPLIENFPLKEAGEHQLFLPFGKDPEQNYTLLETIFFASAQFPLAFPPFPLNFCDLDSTSKKDACTAQKTVTADFIDGGIFNNTPVSLSAIIAEKFFTKKERQDLIYAVITLDGATHPTPANTQQKEPSIINYLLELAGQFTETSRNRSVSEIYLNKNGILKQTISNDKLFPRSSQYYFAFSGFLDQGFREYDFYLGMYEARHFFERYVKSATAEAQAVLQSKMDGEYKHIKNPEWQPYFCFLETYDQDAKAKGACESTKNLKHFPLLMQVNADIVVNRCQKHSKDAEKFKSCSLVKTLKPHSPLLDGESDQQFFYRRLEELAYPYEHAKSKHASGEDLLRAKIEPSFKELIKKQPANQRLLFNETSRILLNTLDFKPQDQYWRLGLGSHIQGSYGRMLASWGRGPWFFGDVGLMVRGVDTYLNTNKDGLALAPFAGAALNFTPKTRFFLEPEVGVRGGYNHALEEVPSICNSTNSNNPSLHCRMGFVQPHIGVGILGRIRLDLGWLIYFDEHNKNEFTMMAEIQF